MKKQIKLLYRIIVCGVLPLAFAASCSVDDKYDISKDIDLTVGVGEGLALPLGSTEKIMITELIDTADADVLSLDAKGYYSVQENGEFTPESFVIDDVDIKIDPISEKEHYDFELFNLSDDYDNLPDWIKEQIKQQKYPYVINAAINNKVDFIIDQSVPAEMKSLRRMTFKNPVKLELELDIFSENHASDDLLEITDELHLLSNDYDGFVIEVPEYIVFSEADNVQEGRLLLNGSAKYDAADKRLKYKKVLTIEALDFSKTKDGALPVVNDKIYLDDELHAYGYVKSDTVMFGFENITHIQSVDVQPEFKIDVMTINEVEGIFEPVIDPISELVDLDLGDDLDFLKDAYLDFNDPRIYVTLSNPVDARIFADASFEGFDKYGKPMEGSKVETSFAFEAGVVNNLFINRYDALSDGYTTIVVPELNNLIKKIPEKIDVRLDARLDNENYTTVKLGEDMQISGNYSLSVPLVFDDFSLEYIEEVDDVLGDDVDDITDYVKDINSITITFDVFNTVPAEFMPSVVAYDKKGVELKNVKAVVEDIIAKGNGMKEDDTVSEPVKSSVKVKLSVTNGELEDLYKLDLKFSGKGKGAFNANEYLQVEDIVVTIDEQISVDLN